MVSCGLAGACGEETTALTVSGRGLWTCSPASSPCLPEKGSQAPVVEAVMPVMGKEHGERPPGLGRALGVG